MRSGENRIGGLAATVELARQEYLNDMAGDNSFLFFHMGSILPDAERGEWQSQLMNRQIHLFDRAGFSAVALDARETGFVAEMKGRDRKLVPALSYDYRWMEKAEYEANLPPHPFLFFQEKEVQVFVTAITGGPEPEFAGSPWRALEHKIGSLPEIDLFILLAPDPVTGNRLVEKLFHPEPSAPLTEDRPLPPPFRTIILIGDAPENRFYRAPSGIQVCETMADNLCDLEFGYRESTLLHIAQRFRHANDGSYPDKLYRENPGISGAFPRSTR